VHQIGFITRIFKDARSTKHKMFSSFHASIVYEVTNYEILPGLQKTQFIRTQGRLECANLHEILVALLSPGRLSGTDTPNEFVIRCGAPDSLHVLPERSLPSWHEELRQHQWRTEGGGFRVFNLYTRVTLPRTVAQYRDSVDGTRDHVTCQKFVPL
jgi:hypothetical protein